MHWRLRLGLMLGCCFPSAGAAAQERSGVVSGAVLDAAHGTPLSDVHVVPLGEANTPSRAGAVTAPAGLFALRVTSDSVRLVAAAIGFAPETLLVKGGTDVRFRLHPTAVTLDPLVVAAEPALSAASSRVVRGAGDRAARRRRQGGASFAASTPTVAPTRRSRWTGCR